MQTFQIVDDKKGTINRQVPTTNGILFDLDSRDHLRVIAENTTGSESSLIYYDLEGNFLKQIKLENFPIFNELYTCSYISFDKKDNLIFFDKNKYIFHFE